MATIKNTVIIYVDEQGKVYTAAGQHVDPRAALGIAWKSICHQAGLTWGQEPAQKPAPPPLPTPGEADEPRCPTHDLARPSKAGGLYCPAPGPGPDGKSSPKGYCTWNFGNVRKP